MSRTRLLALGGAFVVLLLLAGLIAYSAGDFGTLQIDPPGYGVGPTEPSTQTD